MMKAKLATTRAACWDDHSYWRETDSETCDPMTMTDQPQEVHHSSWLTRQVIAAIWILVAWAVGTLVFELGVVS